MINGAETGELEAIRALIDVYSDLIEIGEQINICYGFPTMLAYGLTFFHTLLTFYVALKDLFNAGQIDFETISSASYSAFYNSLFTAIIFFNAKTQQEVRLLELISQAGFSYNFLLFLLKARNVVKIVNEQIKMSKSADRTRLLLGLNSLIKRNPPTFSCGLFDFDWKLTLSSISSLTTNFIILMQFDLISRI